MRREEQVKSIARDCVHFKGDHPCQPHRRAGAVCRCPAYSPGGTKVLIIQLGPAEAVIRSSALVGRLGQDDPNCQITYLTEYPELLDSGVAVPMKLEAGCGLALQMDEFDAAYNLDTDRRAGAIMNLVHAAVKKGFYLRQGQCMPIDQDSYGYYLGVVLPGVWAERRPEPVQEMFQMCGLEYRYEKPKLAQALGRKRTTASEST